jgi:hypothetical protein
MPYVVHFIFDVVMSYENSSDVYCRLFYMLYVMNQINIKSRNQSFFIIFFRGLNPIFTKLTRSNDINSHV